MTGMATGWPAISNSRVCSRPPGQRDTSVDVPPMSKETIRSYPARRPHSLAPTTPPAGPDNTVWIGSRDTRFTDRDPPFEPMILTRSAARLPMQPLQVVGHAGRHVGVDDRGGRALVLSVFGQQPDGYGQRCRAVRQCFRDALLMVGVRVRVEQYHRDRLGLGEPLRQALQLVLGEGLHHLALGPDSASYAHAVLSPDQRSGAVTDQGVELWAGSGVRSRSHPRTPEFVTSMTRAPLRSRREFVATVDP